MHMRNESFQIWSPCKKNKFHIGYHQFFPDLCLNNDTIYLFIPIVQNIAREVLVKKSLKNFLCFERMITPIIIKILFWIGLIGSIIAGIVIFFALLIAGISEGGFGAIIGGFLLGLVAGILAIVFGALVTRVYSELLILAFQINETLTDIKQILKERQ